MFANFFEALSDGDTDAILILCWCLFRIALGVIEIIAARFGVKLYKLEGKSMADKTTEQSEQVVDLIPKENVKKTRPFQKVFTAYVPEYAYDEDTGDLKQVGYIDVNEKIQSYLDTSFEKILEKYLPGEDLEKFFPGIGYKDEQAGVQTYNEQLEDLQEFNDYLLNMKEKYNLNPDFDSDEVLDALKDLNADAKLKVEKLKNTETKSEDPQIDVEEAIAFYKAHHTEEV